MSVQKNAKVTGLVMLLLALLMTSSTLILVVIPNEEFGSPWIKALSVLVLFCFDGLLLLSAAANLSKR